MHLTGPDDLGVGRDSFRWAIPKSYNIGVDVCDRWASADPERPAIIDVGSDDKHTVLSYGAMRLQSDRLAAALRKRGVGRGDRVAVLLPQRPEAVVAHVAIYKLAAIAVPLASVFGIDALAHRLADSGTRAVITNEAGAAKIASLNQSLPCIDTVISVDGGSAEVLDWSALIEDGSPDFTPVDTDADEPALLIYTSGTTGQPKGALHAHRVLPGHLPGFQMSHDFLPQPGDLMWTPADWAWAGGLLNALLPSLHFGVPVVARHVARFEPEGAFAFMARIGIRNAFVPPTALRMLRTVPEPRAHFDLQLRSITSAGEPLGAETWGWARDVLGLSVNEVFGQTECNYVLASCGALGLVRPGAIGRAVPGHKVAVLGEKDRPCRPGEVGQIAVQRPDPAMFLGYWGQPDATAAKFQGDWMVTGDLARTDDDGYVTFLGRDDDLITSTGYRIGPAEIEDCLLRHPAVAAAAAVGKPDALRTEIVKAFVVLNTGHIPSTKLESDIREFVRLRLSAHEYPREIAFVDGLPTTSSGKVLRRLLRAQA